MPLRFEAGELNMSKMEHLVEDLTEQREVLLGLGVLPEDMRSYYQNPFA